MKNRDLTAKEHWDSVYERVKPAEAEEWRPLAHEDLALEQMLLKEIGRSRPGSILEIGCGNSTWLPYLAKRLDVGVCGLDYSEEGCLLARRRLAHAGVRATVHCADLFEATPDAVGTHDFVYSLGVIEHFASPEEVLAQMLKFVRPGGILLAEIPNLVSMHGALMWAYQPEILAGHRPFTKSRLERAFSNLSIGEITSGYLGLFSLGIVSWGYSPRFPAMDRLILPVMKKVRVALRMLLSPVRLYRGAAPFAPFLYVAGRK